MKPFVPYNEEKRLRVLMRYCILDTPPEDRFDVIVRETANYFKAPIALFTLVDENRQWFKSRVGLDIEQTDRAISFCAHAIAIDAPLVVEDASKNHLFASNPLVIGHPKIAFYAGFPVRAVSGEALGALCIIDRSPRLFSMQDCNHLEDFARQIEVQLEARQSDERYWSNRTDH